MFAIQITRSAEDDLQQLRRFDQRLIGNGINAQLRHQPAQETRQ